MDKLTHLRIGELAKQTNLAVGTLRYYSDLGLLQPVQRGDNGYRYYSQDATKQVEFIKKAQAIGFTLEEIKTILDVRDRGEKPCSLVQSLLDNKIEQLPTMQYSGSNRESWVNGVRSFFIGRCADAAVFLKWCEDKGMGTIDQNYVR